ncbi:hypothetical protein SCUCBS95973_009339 [Sporothrix curviconia]|uniref:Autophagy-related protein 17 n=1 Tax=Sporothrix curviconia TaxID=1260050 RepID=A0ABP0CV55_9PEZI
MPGPRGTVPSYRPASQASSRRSHRRNNSEGGDAGDDDVGSNRNSLSNDGYDSRRDGRDGRDGDESNSRHSHHSYHSYRSHHSHEEGGGVDDEGHPAVPVETLVEHLLAARRALGTISQVLRSNEMATEARALYTQAMVDSARTGFLRNGIRQQAAVLVQIRRGMSKAYDVGRRDFRVLIRTLDAANGQLEHTMDILRETTVAAVFRPPGEAPRSLLDFVDEAGVEALRDAIKQSIAELQAAQTSFDGDLLRFDTDLRALNKAMATAPPPPPPLPLEADAAHTHADDDELPVDSPYPVPHLLASLTQRSHRMAENLASLTRHFDLCVTAVRTTEGGLEMARWKAASSSASTASNQQEEPVSISGVIAEHGRHDEEGDGSGADKSRLEPISAQERAEMVQVVLQDATEVDDVVADMAADLHEAEAAFAMVQAHAEQTRAAAEATAAAFRVLEDIGTRLRSYAAAEAEFTERWGNERDMVADRLDDMDELRAFYEGYANAYDTLILEAERRRTVEAKIQTVWRKARDAVERLVEADRGDRANFRQEVGEFLPTDLWLDMDRPPRGADLFASMVEAQQQQQQQQKQQQARPSAGMSASLAAAASSKRTSARNKGLRSDDLDMDAGSGANSMLDEAGSSTRTVTGR